MKLSMFLSVLALGALAWYVIFSLAIPALDIELEKVRNENACIRYYVARGVERADIKRVDGDCTVITYQVNH